MKSVYGEALAELMGQGHHGAGRRGRRNLEKPRIVNGQKIPEAQRRGDVHDLVTARILEKLEAGVVPWQCPSIARVGLPRNFSTGQPYHGINVFLLGSLGFESPWFLTFLQAKALGGMVRRGERGFPIIKMGTWEKKGEGEKAEATEGRLDAEGATLRSFLKVYTVFNSSQIVGLTFPEPPPCPTYTECEQAEAARRIVEGMPKPPKILEGRSSCPCYAPELDEVRMPTKATFRAEWRYYKSLFHELGHATGHVSRLDRRTLRENLGMVSAGKDGHRTYCEEELVAEMAAAFLGAHAGIIEDDYENSTAYLKGWMDVLRVQDHKTWLIRAASEAQKAVNYILGTPAEA